MAKLTRDQLQEIVERDAPGMKLVDRNPEADALTVRASPDLDSPDIDELRAKYLGPAEAPASDAAPRRARRGARAEPADADDDDDVEIVSLTPEKADARDRVNQTKAIVVSGNKGRIIGQQG
jgi:hypothetical protein